MNEVIFYVVTWHYSDRSDYGVVAIRDTEEQAARLVTLLRGQDGTRQYRVFPASMEAV